MNIISHYTLSVIMQGYSSLIELYDLIVDLDEVDQLNRIKAESDISEVVNCANEMLFRKACRDNKLSIAKWLVDTYNINIHVNDNIVFIDAAAKGRIDLLKWLLLLPTANVHDQDEYIFISACGYGQLETAKWLLATYPNINVRGPIINGEYEDSAIMQAVTYGYINILQWFLTLPGTDVHYKDEQIFRLACEAGHLEIAKWMYETYPNINVRAPLVDGEYGDDAFLRAVNEDHALIIDWLRDISFPNYIEVIINGEIDSYVIINKSTFDDELIKTDYQKVMDVLHIKSGSPTPEECSICMDDKLQHILSLPCGHHFCIKCLYEDRSMNKYYECRLCMKPFHYNQCINHERICE